MSDVDEKGLEVPQAESVNQVRVVCVCVRVCVQIVNLGDGCMWMLWVGV
jgi:hypothetical protein